MKRHFRISLLLLLAVIMTVSPALAFTSCKDTSGDDTTATSDLNTDPGDTAAPVDNSTDDVPAIDFGGDEVSLLTFTEQHADMLHDFDEPSDDKVSNGKYLTMTELEERFKCTINEYVESETYVNSTYRSMIQTGADDYDIVFAYDRFAHYFAEEGVIYDYDSLEYIDLTKDYWDQSLLDYTTIYNKVYYAYGTLDFTYYDLTHCLVFNKDKIKQFGLDDPYQLVKSGEWTMDAMTAMMKVATNDDNGDGNMTNMDSYGFVASGKQILPNFWISGGTTTVKLDNDRLPYLSILGNERLSTIIDKCFTMFWDSGYWYVSTGMGNQSDSHYALFAGNQALFADYTFFYLNQLRECEADFGILPYPKLDSDQAKYYSRVEAGTTMATVPITNPEPTYAGAIIEAWAAIGYKNILPEYYESALRRRISRDQESYDMLEEIFKTRVYDLGDTWYCDQIRDGMMATMWNANSNTLSSTYKSYEKLINRTISKTIASYLE